MKGKILHTLHEDPILRVMGVIHGIQPREKEIPKKVIFHERKLKIIKISHKLVSFIF